MSLEHPKNKIYIRFLRVFELILMFPLVALILLVMEPKEAVNGIKGLFQEWVLWFKNAQDFEYH